MTKKWFVPGEAEIDCTASVFRHLEKELDLIAFTLVFLRFSVQNGMVLCVIFVFLKALSLKCNPGVDNQ